MSAGGRSGIGGVPVTGCDESLTITVYARKEARILPRQQMVVNIYTLVSKESRERGMRGDG